MMDIDLSGQIITTSHEFRAPKCWFSKGNGTLRLFLENRVLVKYYEPFGQMYIPSLKLTFSHLKMDGWKTIVFLLGPGFLAGANC